jgi:hypothetical protein
MSGNVAERYLEQLFSRAVELRPDARAAEFDGLLQAANIVVTAYSAAGVFDLEQVSDWRDRIADAVIARRARTKES